MANVSLGIIGRSDSSLSAPGVVACERRDSDVQRVQRFALQSEARRLLPTEAVGSCLRCIRPDKRDVEVWHSPECDTAQFQNLMVCRSVWHDPVCASTITTRRQAELKQGVEFARSHGLVPVLESFTARHTRRDRLADLLPAYLAAMRRFTTGRGAAAIGDQFGVIGSVRALEVTFGDESGWHVHFHVLAFLAALNVLDGYSSARRSRWEASTAAVGLQVNEHGYDCKDTNERIAEYVAKYGRDPRWDVDAELSKWHVKRSRGQRCTPFDLLRDSFAGDDDAGERFKEYAGVFKGRRQLVWSRGLHDLLEVGPEVSDDELAMRIDAGAYLLGRLCRSQWRLVLANDARGEVVNAARTGSWQAVIDVLSDIGALAVGVA